MNQTGWNPSISQFIHVKIILLKMVPDWNPFFFKSTGFISSTFPIQPDFSQNQPATITLNTGSPRTLLQICCGTNFVEKPFWWCVRGVRSNEAKCKVECWIGFLNKNCSWVASLGTESTRIYIYICICIWFFFSTNACGTESTYTIGAFKNKVKNRDPHEKTF